MTTDTQARDAMAGRLFQACLGMMDTLSVYLGDRLGLYEALRSGPATPPELAQRAGIHPRYAREWLEQQAVTGFLDVAEGGDADSRRYNLPGPHAEVLADKDSLAFLAPIAQLLTGVASAVPALVQAYRSGGGVDWAEFGPDAREGQAGANRPIFLQLLGREWLPAIPELDRRLRASPSARVADVGCGAGWSSIAMAAAYPQARVDGFDIDAPSIEMAKANATEHGVADRVQFRIADIASPEFQGSYDLVTAFEMLHDLARPVEALANFRRMLAPGGVVLIADERVADRFTAPGDDIERMMYGWSVLCCLAAGMAEPNSAATGTVMRTSTLAEYAKQAGFSSVQVLPIEHEALRLYLVR